MSLDKDSKERLKWIYQAEGAKDLENRYDLWAKEYDADVAGYGYKIPGVIAGFLGRYLRPEGGTLLDAGAGTGIMGEIMFLLGYKELVAMDMSNGMLDIAKQKGVYMEIHRMVMGEKLDFPDDKFAGTMAVGVLSVGHAPPESFSELIRCTRPGGHIIFSVRADAQGFKEKQAELEQLKKWRLIEATSPFVSLPLGEPDIKHMVFVYRVE
ncbi:class I SAM-dependent DNA methyltransferase [Chloroflexota bacterium]